MSTREGTIETRFYYTAEVGRQSIAVQEQTRSPFQVATFCSAENVQIFVTQEPLRI
jgi:hypothetical protein